MRSNLDFSVVALNTYYAKYISSLWLNIMFYYSWKEGHNFCSPKHSEPIQSNKTQVYFDNIVPLHVHNIFRPVFRSFLEMYGIPEYDLGKGLNMWHTSKGTIWSK